MPAEFPTPVASTAADGPRALEEALAGSFLFRAWGAEDLKRVAAFSRMETFTRGTILFQHGSACGELFLLLRGRAQLLRVTAEGREVTLHELGPGALVACAAMFLGREYPATARVVSREAALVRLRGEPFLRLLAERPDLSRKMIAALALRIGELADRLETRSSKPALARFSAWLLEQPSVPDEDGARRVKLTQSRKALAAGLNMTPETFSRCQSALAREGVIRIERRALAILDAPALERRAAQ